MSWTSVARASFRALGYDIVRVPPRPRKGKGRPVSIDAVPFPRIDDLELPNPVPAILNSATFQQTVERFKEQPSVGQSLLSPDAQALLFAIVRNYKPPDVIEIGTFQAGTSETICRALYENGAGVLHTIDPYGARRVPSILDRWPADLLHHVAFYPTNSMRFFMEFPRTKRPELIFIDGNHDYEFASFDIRSAARIIAPAGFLFVDNISQPGPYFAACDLLKEPGWRGCGHSVDKYRPEFAFDAHRASIHNTDFMVLRAPPALVVGSRPVTTGQIPLNRPSVDGVVVSVANGSTPEGWLYAQCIVRSFGGGKQTEIIKEAKAHLEGNRTIWKLTFDDGLVGDQDANCTAEIWLTWDGSEPLKLSDEPHVV